MTRTILDTRDLEDELAALLDTEELDRAEDDRLQSLEALKAELDGYGWEHGIGLIPVEDFEDYARDLAEDIGAIDPDASWPNTYIDWEAAARALAQDYSLITFDGQDYYWREA